MLQAQRHAEHSASAALQIQDLQEQLAAEQSAKETERQVRERAEQQVTELKVPAPTAPGRMQQIIPVASAMPAAVWTGLLMACECI